MAKTFLMGTLLDVSPNAWISLHTSSNIQVKAVASVIYLKTPLLPLISFILDSYVKTELGIQAFRLMAG